MKRTWMYCLLVGLMFFTIGCSNDLKNDENEARTSESEELEDTKLDEPQEIPKDLVKEEKKEKEKEKDLETLKKEALDFSLEILALNILIQDEEFKSLYPDLFSVEVKNNTEVDIRDYQVAVMAWDSNDLPIKLKGSIDFSDGRYIVVVNANDVNLIPGATDGEQSGLPLDKEMTDLHTLQAVVLEYTDFDDNTVKNEAAKAFLDAIEGKTLK